MQEGFDEVMKEYPEMSKAMDLVAEHRIRALHKSRPWLKQQHETGAENAGHDKKRLDHALLVSGCESLFWLLPCQFVPGCCQDSKLNAARCSGSSLDNGNDSIQV